MLRLTKRVKNGIIIVNSLVELALELVLTHAYQEVADEFGDCLADRPDCDLENGVDTSPHLSHEDVGTALRWLLGLLRHAGLTRLLAWLPDRLSVLIVLDGHLFILRHY